jgi:hypothetical protein
MSQNQKSDGFAVKEILTHTQPHPDELWAIFLLQQYGEDRYPGISRATIIFSQTGNKTPDGRTAEEWEKDGVLMVGTGGGRFDEHAKMNGQPGAKGECAFTMVCKDLRVCDDPALRRIFPYVRDEDTKGGKGDICSFGNTLKALYEDPDIDHQEAVNIGLKCVRAFYRKEAEFADAEIIVGREGMITVDGANGPIRILAVESENRAISRAGRRRGADVVIQKHPTGNPANKLAGKVQIYTNRKDGDLDMRDLVRLLRLEEDYCRDRPTKADWKMLERDGKSQEIGEEWFYHQDGVQILNGSLSSPEVSPTAIPIRRIVDLAVMAMSRGFESGCGNNHDLTPCRGSRNCRWYQAGLVRCRKVRYQTAATQTV